MKKITLILAVSASLILSGCAVRSYTVTRDRVDQDLSSGNRGYLLGKAPEVEKERKQTRTTRVIEVELGGKGIKFDKETIEKEPLSVTPVTELLESEIEEPKLPVRSEYATESVMPEITEPVKDVYFEKYTVQKNDTLQKISQRFYGTTRKYMDIYNANTDVLSAPNKIYPGQVIKIPLAREREGK